MQPADAAITLVAIAQEFSPRYERHRDDLVSIDVSGLDAAARAGADDRRGAAPRGGGARRARARRGRRHADGGARARAGAARADGRRAGRGGRRARAACRSAFSKSLTTSKYAELAEPAEKRDPQRLCGLCVLCVPRRWGLEDAGRAGGAARRRSGRRGSGGRRCAWQAIARGEDLRPLVPTLEEERFEASLELEWPIADLEPLSFVLTRLLEPLSTRLERRDRGAAVLHVLLRLVTRETYARRLELPTPMRDVRALRTLALLDLEAHPPPAAIDRVTIVIDPTPGRVLQHTLFTRAQPTPEQLSTLLARLGALMGQDRFGAPAAVDTDRPGAFAMTPFATDHDDRNAELAEHRRERHVGTSAALRALRVLSRQPSVHCRPPCAAAASRCRRASRSPTAGRCASRPIAAASPAARSRTAPGRGGRQGSGGQESQKCRSQKSGGQCKRLSSSPTFRRRRRRPVGSRRVGRVAERRRGLSRLSRPRRRRAGSSTRSWIESER